MNEPYYNASYVCPTVAESQDVSEGALSLSLRQGEAGMVVGWIGVGGRVGGGEAWVGRGCVCGKEGGGACSSCMPGQVYKVVKGKLIHRCTLAWPFTDRSTLSFAGLCGAKCRAVPAAHSLLGIPLLRIN